VHKLPSALSKSQFETVIKPPQVNVATSVFPFVVHPVVDAVDRQQDNLK
jgi:hypothetical protein